MIWISFLPACEEHSVGGVDPPQTEKKVQLELFTRTNEYGTPVLRSLANEDEIEPTPWVLVFKGSNENAVFVEAVQAFQLAGINKRYIILTEQTSTCQLLILANPQDYYYYIAGNSTPFEFTEENFNTHLGGQNLSYACTNLLTEPLSNPQTEIPYSGNMTIPMSFVLPVLSINKDTEIGTSSSLLELKRAVAKIVIKNSDTNFAFDSITAVVNVPKQGRLHQLGTTALMNNTGNLIEYNAGDLYATDMISSDSGGTTENDPVYLYESGTDNKTYIIIKGQYNGKTYYYKVSIVDANKNPVDILRNYKYTITISSVGPGFETINDLKTFQGSNSNITYNIRIVDESSFEISTNENYYLALSNSVFIAYTDGRDGSEDEFNPFTLTTNCTINFPDARYITHNNEFGHISLIEPAPDKPGTGQKSEIPITGNSNSPVAKDVIAKISTSLGNTGIFTLKLGDLEKNISVRSNGALPAAGSSSVLQDNYYLLSGYIEEGSNTKDWIKLTSSTGIIRNDSASIVVDNGVIRILAEPNTTGGTRRGVVYLTAAKNPGSNQAGNTFRIKLDITQRRN